LLTAFFLISRETMVDGAQLDFQGTVEKSTRVMVYWPSSASDVDGGSPSFVPKRGLVFSRDINAVYGFVFFVRFPAVWESPLF
jgi:hypothetical protein